jgi:hypothetical protein
MLLALQRAVMVQVVEQPVQETTVADVLLGAVGLTGALVIGAVILGALFGAALIALKKTREKYHLEQVPDSEALKIN